MRLKIFFSIILLSFIAACGSKKKPEIDASFHFANAIKNIKAGNLNSAQDALDKIETDFPYSDYSVKAELLIAFIHYLKGDYADSIVAAEKFIKLRPANPEVDYMYFMRAESFFQSRSDFLREQDTSIKAQNNFKQLLTRFPGSKYNGYSNDKLKILAKEIAHYNLQIALTHQNRKEYIPALRRLKFIAANFPDSIYLSETYFRMVEIYYSLGLKEQATAISKQLAEQNKKDFWSKQNQKFIAKYL